ncbi:hypothetical protein [Albidovulum sp.]
MSRIADRRRRQRRQPQEIGASPTTIFVPSTARPTTVRSLVYDGKGCATQEGLAADPGPGRFRRIDIAGLADRDAIVAVASARELWFPVTESYGDRMEALGEQILADPGDGPVTEVHRLKRDPLEMRRAIRPLREAVGAMLREDRVVQLRPDERVAAGRPVREPKDCERLDKWPIQR